MKAACYISIGLMVAASTFPASAPVAQSPTPGARNFDHCTGFIDSLPSVIFTPGTWCLRRDLSTAVDRRPAILVFETDDITIDCNNFTIDGLGTGAGTLAIGIANSDSFNTTVRRCKVRGFHRGIVLGESSGNLIEDNELDLNSAIGIRLNGGGVVQRNIVRDTGIPPLGGVGISTGEGTIDVIDNTISGVFSSGVEDFSGVGISVGQSGTIMGNRVRDVRVGIAVGSGGAVTVMDNHLSSYPGRSRGQPTTIGVWCFNRSSLVSGNHLVGFSRPLLGCNDSGNRIAPRREAGAP